jgi:hypothetical protein
MMLLLSCSQNKSRETVARVEDAGSVKGEIRFERTEHDLGTIQQGETVGYNFSFTNTGDGPLVILDAEASCGCTVPRFSREPVLPGGKGTVEVRFDSEGRVGKQTKTVTIQTDSKTPVVKLTIHADIIDSNHSTF